MVETYMIYQKIAPFHIHCMIQCITACYIKKICVRDITLKEKFQYFHIKFWNSDFSLSNALNITKFSGDALVNFLCSERSKRVQ